MTEHPRVGVIMGSDSDWSVMADAAAALAEFDIPAEVRRGLGAPHATGDVRLRAHRGRPRPRR